MVDNVETNTASGGAVFATDDISSVHYQRVKINYGVDGAATDVSDTNPLPVDDAGGSLTVDNGGTFATQVDGDALTALQLIDNIVLATDSAAGGTDAGVQLLAVRDDALTTLTPIDGDYTPLRVDSVGRVHVALGGTPASNLSTLAGAVSGSEMQVDIVASAAIPVTDNAGSLTVDGTITANLSATDNAVLDSIQTAVEVIDNAISGTEMQVDVVAALPAGTNAIGKLAANTGVDIGDVDVTSISAGANLIGDVGIQGRASGGLTIFRSIDIDESEEEVKATAGTVYAITAFNSTAAPIFLKFYNLTAANTTVGTSTPVLTFLVPANADSDGSGFIFSVAQGIAFSTAISVAATTAVADADTGAPGANACMVHVFYS